ncbi:MAG: type III polyketide synthase [Herbiconiux sp.]|nr:type III polyketide synthase [Herbiconiux sp.]
MAVSVRTIQTAVPATTIAQHAVRDLFAAQPDLNRLGRRLVTASFDASGIATRHTVVAELDRSAPVEHPRFVDPGTGEFLNPSTRERNERYIEAAPELAVEAAAKALDALGLAPGAVTHVITASCTGFFAPGPDYVLVRRLGLDPAVQRFHVGFMGCYAAFPALRMAKAFCEADPAAVVLVVCVELCTLHMRSSNEADQIVASSVFADGAAAAIVSARDDLAAAPEGAAIERDAFASILTPVGETDMAWTIGDHGFEMVLSSYVPKIIDEHITGALQPLLEPAGITSGEVAHWAVHPGGRSILDRVESKLGLTERQLAPSRATLRDVGNISSATVLFVLKRLLESDGGPDGALAADGEQVCAMAFGPGLTVETGLFTVRRPAS